MNLMFLFLSLLIMGVLCTISSSDKKSKKKGKPNKVISTTVFERKLVVENVTAADILVENERYFKNTTVKNFEGTVLGYVTPWNSHGYGVARTFCGKLTHVSPVWLTVQPRKDGFVVVGDHDVDEEWLAALRRCGNGSVKVLPRVMTHDWTWHDWSRLAAGPSRLATVLHGAARRWGLDGFVLELWNHGVAYLGSVQIVDTFRELTRHLKSHGLLVVFAVPPAMGRNPEPFNRKHFDALVDYVDAFSLMTYDYSSPQRPGANSPVPWARACVEELVEPGDPRRAKILMGLNLYGYEYTTSGGGPIINHQYLELLRRYGGMLKWDYTSQEHYFEFKDVTGSHHVFYPTLYSLHRHILLAKTLGVGLSLWELGQGLDYFYDLF